MGDGYEATLVFPAVVQVVCAWCGEFIRVKETEADLPNRVDFGICDACALAELPPELHAKWNALKAQDEAAGMEQIGSRCGEQLSQEVVK